VVGRSDVDVETLVDFMTPSFEQLQVKEDRSAACRDQQTG
jgi:hypothetical protein